MDTAWLADLRALAETLNFSRAAERRNITQPAFGRRIRSLEAWCGAELVDRSTHRLRLTSAGEIIRLRTRQYPSAACDPMRNRAPLRHSAADAEMPPSRNAYSDSPVEYASAG